MQALQRSVWQALSTAEKEATLRELPLPEGFSLLRMDTFARYGQQLETGVFGYGDCEFVFIPGDKVTLGWENRMDRMDAPTRAELEKGLEELGRSLEEAPELMRQLMSPLREVTIGPMLVERHIRSVSWEEATAEELAEDEELQADLATFLQSGYNAYELNETHRFTRIGDEVRVELFWTSDDYPEWAETTLTGSVAILTEDEWEYLYGGGSRTLFPWGDSFDYTMKVRHFGELQPAAADEDNNAGDGLPAVERPYDLELPNAFGLYFLGDPYQCELTVSADGVVRGKGGDGGSAICGGLGVLLGYLPTATAYRDPYAGELEWPELIGYFHFRRIVRL